MKEQTESGGQSTAIKACTCKHSFQDKRYGHNRRVHNRTVLKTGTTTQWRCTVCKTVH